MHITPQTHATLIGIIAPICWGMSVGLVRTITETFGLAAGMSILYGTTCLFLFFLLGRPNLKAFPKKYLLLGLPTANMSSICFSLSLYLSNGGQQTVEVGMVNYLWPCLVVVFAIMFNGQKARWWVIPGVLISFAGVVMVLGGERGFNAAEVMEHIRLNPWSYLLAFLSAVTWAIYSNLTRAWSGGQNPTLIIFILDFIIFSSLWAAGYGDLSGATLHGCLSVAIGAAAMGGAYAAWSYGVTKGNITVLGVASYFTPILSCLFASIWIGASLDTSFWSGVAVVVFGSLMCWSSTYLRR